MHSRNFQESINSIFTISECFFSLFCSSFERHCLCSKEEKEAKKKAYAWSKGVVGIGRISRQLSVVYSFVDTLLRQFVTYGQKNECTLFWRVL